MINNDELNEINLLPIRETRKLGMDLSDLIWFACFLIPIFIIAFSTGFTIGWAIGIAIYAILAAFFCFFKTRKMGKLRHYLWKNIKFWFAKKEFNEQETKGFYQFDQIENNHLHYFHQGQRNEGWISIYRINGFDLSLTSEQEKAKIINNLAEFFGHHKNYNIVSLEIQYQIPKKEFKLKKANDVVKQLQSNYNRYMQDINNDIKAKQVAYFLVLDNAEKNENEQQFITLNKLLNDAKINLSIATNYEIQEILNSIWLTDSIDIKNIKSNKLRSMRVFKKYVQLVEKPNEQNKTRSEYLATININCLPDIATESYLRNIVNTNDCTLIWNSRYIDPEAANEILKVQQDKLAAIISGRWYKKNATDLKRAQIDKVYYDLQFIIDQLARNSNYYVLRENIFSFVFKGFSKKSLNQKISKFLRQIEDYEKGFVVNENQCEQLGGFVNTRLYEIPNFQYTNSNTTKLKKRETAIKTAGEFIRNNAVDALNTSLAIGYPFSNVVADGANESWYRGKFIDNKYNIEKIKPIFDNYWLLNNNRQSFNRIYLAHTGAGKTWTAKRDIICDYFDNNYIVIIDPKADYGKMVAAIGGENILLGINSKDKKTKSLNIFDVIDFKVDEAIANEIHLQTPLQRTYIRLDAIIKALLDLNNKNDEQEILSVWREVCSYVYETQYKFNDKTNFDKVKKMPIMDDFYKATLLYMKKDPSDFKMKKLATLLKQYTTGSTYGYLFNNQSNIDWNMNQLFNLDISAIAQTQTNIFGSFIIYLMNLSLDIMNINKYRNMKFALYIDEFHRVRDVEGVLSTINTFVRLSRAFNGSCSIIDQGLGVISGLTNKLYNEIFEQVQYTFFFNSSENDIKKIREMMEYSGKPLTNPEHLFISRAKHGECLSVMSAWERYRVSNDVDWCKDFLLATRSESKFYGG